MAQFNITAKTINKQFNADVINMTEVARMSDDERDELLKDLIEELVRHVQRTDAQPIGGSAQPGTELVHVTRNLEQNISAAATPEDRKKTIASYLQFLKSSLGSTADIVVSAVKIAQLLGL